MCHVFTVGPVSGAMDPSCAAFLMSLGGGIASDLLHHALALQLEDRGRISPAVLLALVQCGPGLDGGGVVDLLLHAKLGQEIDRNTTYICLRVRVSMG